MFIMVGINVESGIGLRPVVAGCVGLTVSSARRSSMFVKTINLVSLKQDSSDAEQRIMFGRSYSFYFKHIEILYKHFMYT